MKSREIKIQRQKFSVEKRTLLGASRWETQKTSHRHTRSSHCKEDWAAGGSPSHQGFILLSLRSRSISNCLWSTRSRKAFRSIYPSFPRLWMASSSPMPSSSLKLSQSSLDFSRVLIFCFLALIFPKRLLMPLDLFNPDPAGGDGTAEGTLDWGFSFSFCLKKDLASLDVASTSLITLYQGKRHQVYKRKKRRETKSNKKGIKNQGKKSLGFL